MFLRYALCPLIAICLFGQSPAPTAQKPDVTPASANANQPPAAPPIQVQVNEVIVPVTVTDDKGRFVSDLEQKDFTVFDEGKEQQIQFFTRERLQPSALEELSGRGC
jgi:hypothetical protein